MRNMKKMLSTIVMARSFVAMSGSNAISSTPYWQLDGGHSITWRFDGRAHDDHIEMSGKRMSVVLRYGIDAQGRFHVSRGMVSPMLRVIPNDTYGSLMRTVSWNPLEAVTISPRWWKTSEEQVEQVTLCGMMVVKSRIGNLQLVRILSPSVDQPALIERYVFTNLGTSEATINVDEWHQTMKTAREAGVKGVYRIEQVLYGAGKKVLAPGESYAFSTALTAVEDAQPTPVVDAEKEINQRTALVADWQHSLQLETPDDTLNSMFAFSKIRALESIYQTQGGPMHGPGGEAYYAAIWANDQAEYINPFFPFTGYEYGCQSAVNSYRHFARFMNDAYRPIPSSIIAEGLDIWNKKGDRGDQAMIAYGASRYALARGSCDEALQLWPLIQWCLEYCHRQLNKQGVVASDTDELENRFPSGEANLCTSSLYYDALLSAASLAKALGQSRKVVRQYGQEAALMARNIETYFHRQVQGFDTYQYFDGCKLLRSWICVPLTMGLFDHAAGTIDALYSDKLWSQNGVVTQQGSTTYWDRSTLYAFRGALMAGDTERSMAHLRYYSATRLLGEHVPYAIEAWPEGNQRHLSAESALYARVFTEGLFGIRPTGFRSFSLQPRLPEAWPQMALRHVRICQSDFDIVVSRTDKGLKVDILKEGKTLLSKRTKGERIDISL